MNFVDRSQRANHYARPPEISGKAVTNLCKPEKFGPDRDRADGHYLWDVKVPHQPTLKAPYVKMGT